MFDIIETTVSADVASAGTVTLAYPSGRDSGDYRGAHGHIAVWGGNQKLTSPGDFTLTFGTSSITFTLGAGKTTIPADSRLVVQVEHVGANDSDPEPETDEGLLNRVEIRHIDLGAPDAASANAVATVQLAGGAGNLTLDGSLVAGGVATLDRPRNVTLTGATTDHSGVTATVTGTDEFGNTVVENITCPFNNTVAGKKSFKTVTQVAVNGAIATNGISVGFGDVLGLPVFLPETAFVLREMQDGVAPTAGTIVAGVTAVATATTGDVRGTYDPNAACDGAKAFGLIAVLPDVSDKGVAQFAG